ncbi:MAG: hypothetical protein A3H97_07695 [Acidobacteria bacterium RIFCSPLOWO2_02_FULL_65_29]|nr:MAG: hypothetical protein A3H97_07695 [Acidobacteria bacterium RIFCSPLOWO2_02_FULL_65_29]
MHILWRLPFAAFFALSALALAMPAGAQHYPTKPVRVITGFPGTAMDVVLRQLGERLGERWGQPVVVENRGGVGAAVAAQATPDGYTLLQSDQTVLAVRPSLIKNLPYATLRDFAPITLVASVPSFVVVHPSVPANDLREFIAWAKRQPNGVDFATAGPATGGHLQAANFKTVTGVNVVPINYKGGGAALMAIVSGETKAGVVGILLSLPYVKAGKLKAYAITSKRRFTGAPDLPTVGESGIPELAMNNYWFGILAPVRTPAALVAKINRDIVEALQTPELKAALQRQGAEPAPSTPEQFTAFIRSETERLRQVMHIAGIRVE